MNCFLYHVSPHCLLLCVQIWVLHIIVSSCPSHFSHFPLNLVKPLSSPVPPVPPVPPPRSHLPPSLPPLLDAAASSSSPKLLPHQWNNTICWLLATHARTSSLIYFRCTAHARPAVRGCANRFRMSLAATVDARASHNNNTNKICISTFPVWGFYFSSAVGNRALDRGTDCLPHFLWLRPLLTMGAEGFANLHGSFSPEQKQESWPAS